MSVSTELRWATRSHSPASPVTEQTPLKRNPNPHTQNPKCQNHPTQGKNKPQHFPRASVRPPQIQQRLGTGRGEGRQPGSGASGHPPPSPPPFPFPLFTLRTVPLCLTEPPPATSGGTDRRGRAFGAGGERGSGWARLRARRCSAALPAASSSPVPFPPCPSPQHRPARRRGETEGGKDGGKRLCPDPQPTRPEPSARTSAAGTVRVRTHGWRSPLPTAAPPEGCSRNGRLVP